MPCCCPVSERAHTESLVLISPACSQPSLAPLHDLQQGDKSTSCGRSIPPFTRERYREERGLRTQLGRTKLIWFLQKKVARVFLKCLWSCQEVCEPSQGRRQQQQLVSVPQRDAPGLLLGLDRRRREGGTGSLIRGLSPSGCLSICSACGGESRACAW